VQWLQRTAARRRKFGASSARERGSSARPPCANVERTPPGVDPCSWLGRRQTTGDVSLTGRQEERWCSVQNFQRNGGGAGRFQRDLGAAADAVGEGNARVFLGWGLGGFYIVGFGGENLLLAGPRMRSRTSCSPCTEKKTTKGYPGRFGRACGKKWTATGEKERRELGRRLGPRREKRGRGGPRLDGPRVGCFGRRAEMASRGPFLKVTAFPFYFRISEMIFCFNFQNTFLFK
jgi:hypothetical protein